VRQELSKSGAKICQVACTVERFEKTHAAANSEAFRPCQLAGMVIIEQQGIRLDFFSQKNCAEFSNPQSMFFLRCQQGCWVLKLLYFNPC
jgi:hypothetical protein